MESLVLYPEEVNFADVRPNQTYIQNLEIKNILTTSVSFRIRVGNSDRFSVEPSLLTLGPGETRTVQIRLKLNKAVARKKNGSPYKETFFLKSEYFEKKFMVSFQPADPNSKIAVPSLPLAGRPAHESKAAAAFVIPNPCRESAQHHDSMRDAMEPGKDSGIMNLRRQYEEYISELKADFEKEIRTRDLSNENLKARLENYLSELSQLQGVARECEQLRRKCDELDERCKDWERKREELEEGESVLQKQVEYVREMQAQLLEGKVDHNMIQKKADEELEERDRKVLRILKAKDQKIENLQCELQRLSDAKEESESKRSRAESLLRECEKELENLQKDRDEKVGIAMMSNVEVNQECLGLKARLEEFQGKLVEQTALKKQMQDSIKSKSKMEIQLDELLRERAENEDELIDLREKAKILESKDMQIAELQREIKAQSSQLDALVAELSIGREYARGGMEERNFPAAKSNAIDSSSTKVSRDKNLQIERNRTLNRFFYLQQNHVLQEIQNGLSVPSSTSLDMSNKAFRMEAIIDFLTRTWTLAYDEQLISDSPDLKTLQSQFVTFCRKFKIPSHNLHSWQQPFAQLNENMLEGSKSPDSLGTITLVESDGDSAGCYEPSTRAKQGTEFKGNFQSDVKNGSNREQVLEGKLKDAEAKIQRLNAQVSKLERIQQTAQGTALAQEEQLNRAAGLIDKSNENMEGITSKLSLELNEWRGRAEGLSKEAKSMKSRAEALSIQNREYADLLKELEAELVTCKQTLRLYHDRIVAFAGKDDSLVQQNEKIVRSDHSRIKGILVSKTTNEIENQLASEKKHLERTIAMQSKALESLRSNLMQVEHDKISLQEEWDQKLRGQKEIISNLNHELRIQRESGHLKIQDMERNVKILSSKSDLHKKVANLMQEISALRASEQRLQMDLDFSKQQAENFSKENKSFVERIAKLEKKVILSKQHSGSDDLLINTMSHQLEIQEEELKRLEGLLKLAKEEHDRQSSEIDTSSKLHKKKEAELHAFVGESEKFIARLERNLTAVENDVSACRKDFLVSAQQLKNERLSKALVERYVESLKRELLDQQEEYFSSKVGVPERIHVSTVNFQKELSAMQQRLIEVTREKDQLKLEREQRQFSLQEAENQTFMYKKSVEALERENEELRLSLREADSKVKQAREYAQRENERLQLNLTNASAQLTVLLETIEALQGTSPLDRQIAVLTASISSCKANELQLQISNSELHHLLEDRVWRINQLEAENGKLQEKCSFQSERLQASKDNEELQTREIGALRAEMTSKDNELAAANQMLDRQAMYHNELESEIHAYKLSLDDETRRHKAELQQRLEEVYQDSQYLIAKAQMFESPFQAASLRDQILGTLFQRAEQYRREVEAHEVLTQQMLEDFQENMISDATLMVEQLIQAKFLLEWNLTLQENKNKILSSSLDMSLRSQILEENRVADVLQRWRESFSSEHNKAWTRVAVLESKIQILISQLDLANKRAVEYSSSLAQACADRDSLSQAHESLKRRQEILASEHSMALANATLQAEKMSSSKVEELRKSLLEYFRNEILKYITDESFSDPIVRLADELSSQKAAQELLKEELSHAQRRLDDLRKRNTIFSDENQRLEERMVDMQHELKSLKSKTPQIDLPCRPEDLYEMWSKAEADLFTLKAELQIAHTNAEKSHEEASKFKALYEDSERWKSETALSFRSQLDKLEKEFLAQKSDIVVEFQRNKEIFERQNEMELERIQKKWEELEKIELLRQSRNVIERYTQTDLDLVKDVVNSKENDLVHDEEAFRLSAEINGLKGETFSLQEELMRKDEILASLEKTLAQVASKDGSKNQASATALSKQVIAAKVAETDANRKLKRALQTEQELRIVIAQKDGTIQQLQQTQNLFFSMNEQTNKNLHEVAASQDSTSTKRRTIQGTKSAGKSPQDLLDWLYVLDNILDKQSSSEQVFIQALWDLNEHHEIPSNILSRVKSQLVEEIAQKASLKSFIAELDKNAESTQFSSICATLSNRVQHQMNNLSRAEKDMQAIILHGGNQVPARGSNETLKELNVTNPKRTVKIKEPVKERYEKEMNSLKQKMLEATSKHALEVDRLKRQLADARIKIDCLNLEQREVEYKEVEADDRQKSLLAEQVKQQTEILQHELAAVVQEYAVQLRLVRIHINDFVQFQRAREEIQDEANSRLPAIEEESTPVKGNESNVSSHDPKTNEVLVLHQEIYGFRLKEESYKKRIRELEHELSDVKTSESGQAKESSQSRVPTHDAELELASRCLKEMDTEVKLKESLSKLNKANEALNIQVREQTKENSLLKQKLDDVVNQLSECKKDLKNQESRACSAETKHLKFIQDRNNFSNFASQIQREISQVIREVGSVTTVVEKQFLFHKEVIHDKNSQIESMQRRIVELEEVWRKDSNKRMRETEELVKSLRAEREELYRRCDALNQQLDKKTAESSAQMLRFQEELNHYKTEQEALEQEYVAQIDNQRKKLADAENLMSSLNGEIASLRRKLEEKSSEAEKSNAKVLALEAQQWSVREEYGDQVKGSDRSHGSRSRVLPPPDSPVSEGQGFYDSPNARHVDELKAQDELIASLRARVAALQATSQQEGPEDTSELYSLLEVFKKELKEHKDISKATTAKLDAMSEELEGAKEELKAKNKACTRAEEERSRAEERAASLQRELSFVRERVVELESDKEKMRKQIKEDMTVAANEMEAMHQQLIAMEGWHSPDEWASLKDDLKREREHVKSVSAEMAKKSQMLSACKADRAEQDLALKSMQQERDNLDEKLKRLTKDLKAKEQTIKNLREKLSSIEEREDVAQEVQRLQEKVKSLNADLLRKEGIIKELRLKIDKLNQQVSELQEKEEQVATLRESIRKLRGDVERKEESAKAAKLRVDAITAECESLQENVKQLEAKDAKLQKLVLNKMADIETANGVAKTLESSLRSLGSLLLAQVETLLAKLQYQFPRGTDVPHAGSLAGGSRRLQDGEKILEMTLSPPLDAMQIRDSLMRFIEERVRLEVMVEYPNLRAGASSKKSERESSSSHAHKTPTRKEEEPAPPPSAGAARGGGGGGGGGWGGEAGGAAFSSTPESQQVRSSSEEIDRIMKMKDVVKAQVEEIQQRLGIPLQMLSADR